MSNTDSNNFERPGRISRKYSGRKAHVRDKGKMPCATNEKSGISNSFPFNINVNNTIFSEIQSLNIHCQKHTFFYAVGHQEVEEQWEEVYQGES